MGIFFIVLIVVGCPLLMVYMMRGMGGGHATTSAPEMAKPKQADQVRIEQLEAEVARLHTVSLHKAMTTGDDRRRVGLCAAIWGR